MFEREITARDLREQVLYALLRPAARLAQLFGVPAKELARTLQIAYFHELRGRGLTIREIAERLELSERSAARLSKELKTQFLSSEDAHLLPRQIEFVLWPGPLSEARLQQTLPNVEPAALRGALESLLAEGRITLRGGRTPTYAVVRSGERLVRSSWVSRVGGLNSLLGTVLNAVFIRFFDDARAPAFARNISLRVRPTALEWLARFYEQELWPKLLQLDEEARGDEAALPLSLALCWAPYEYVEHLRGAEEENQDE